MGTIIHECIEDYYNRVNDSPKLAAQAKIIQEFTARGVARPKVIQAIAAAKSEKDLLEKFRTGEFKKPDGELYSAPRMTKIWKTEAAALGLNKTFMELASVEVKGVKLPDGGLLEMVSRILDLIDRYEDKLMIDREWFEEIHPEIAFDFLADNDVRFLGFMDLVGKIKPEYREKFGGKSWVLTDYKTGKAHDLEDHSNAAHESLQLTLYQHTITEELKLCSADDLYVALHYLDATYAAETTRVPSDFEKLIQLGRLYQQTCTHPGLVKRLFYDSRDCQGCELRDACIKHFGMPTSACAKSNPTEDLDWSF